MDRVRSYFGYKPIEDGPVGYAKASSAPSSSKTNVVERGSGFGFWGKRNSNPSQAGGDESASYVREMVSRATSDMLIGADWALNMEVVEHVADVDSFLDASCALVAPGGLMFIATLNRTMKSFAFSIVGAEYVMRWLPRGTHDWRKFVRPSEMAHALRRGGLSDTSFAGLAFDPLHGSWRVEERDISVNYMGYAVRPQ